MKQTVRLAILCCVAALLSACSSGGNDGGSLTRVIADTALTTFKSQRQGPRARTKVTRKMLDNTKEAALQVEPEKAGGTDFLRRIAARSDSLPGRLEVWKSSDNAQVFLRNGVVVGTRGVGGDIISSDIAPIVAAVSATRAGGGERRMFIDRGDLVATEIQLACEVERLGSEKVLVVYKEFSTVRMRETCVGGPTGETRIVNDYWVQPGSGLVRKSRQWVGPYSGYFDFLLLKN